MAIGAIEQLGRNTTLAVAGFGQFCQFAGTAIAWLFRGVFSPRSFRLLLPQMFEVGTRSVPVVAITGAFIGMVMAIETYVQFKTFGQESRLGSVIALSVVKQIGPVLAAIMVAGRVGGALTAELGTMNVTEQLDAMRVMGADPIRYLVVPRVVACILLTPVLTVFSDLLGVAGGWLVSVMWLGIPNEPYWQYSALGVDTLAILEGIIKAVFFGGAIGMIACYKGFTSGAGASGVGRACTDAFVTSFLAIIAMNLFFAQLLHQIRVAIGATGGLFG